MKRTILPLLASSLLFGTSSAQTPYVFTQVNPPIDEEALLGGLGLTDEGMMAFTQRIPFRPGLAQRTRGAAVWADGASSLLLRSNGSLLWANYDVRDINDQGTVVGIYGRERWIQDRGFAWYQGRRHDLVAPDHLASYPEAINAHGEIVGWTASFSPTRGGAVKWDENLTPSYLPGLRKATDINDLGQYVGYGDDAAGVQQPYFFDGTKLINIGTLPGGDVEATVPLALNNKGEVVGSVANNGRLRAFKWSVADGMVELLNSGPLQFPFSVAASDINDAGWVVGRNSLSSGSEPAVWDPNGNPTPLAMLTPNVGSTKPWKFLAAYSINEHGQIGGICARTNLGARAFILTPAALGLSLQSSMNGIVDLALGGATPGAEVQLHATPDDGSRAGYDRLPGCGGMGLAMNDPLPVASAVVQPDGTVAFRWTVPAALLGVPLKLQVAETANCSVSNLVRVTP